VLPSSFRKRARAFRVRNSSPLDSGEFLFASKVRWLASYETLAWRYWLFSRPSRLLFLPSKGHLRPRKGAPAGAPFLSRVYAGCRRARIRPTCSSAPGLAASSRVAQRPRRPHDRLQQVESLSPPRLVPIEPPDRGSPAGELAHRDFTKRAALVESKHPRPFPSTAPLLRRSPQCCR
jgi:hypothetical protein